MKANKPKSRNSRQRIVLKIAQSSRSSKYRVGKGRTGN